jgi:hypothetical protein
MRTRPVSRSISIAAWPQHVREAPHFAASMRAMPARSGTQAVDRRARRDAAHLPLPDLYGWAGALAETHVELVLIHPFREGNGRIARVLATLMGLQAGLPPLDFSLIAGPARKAYFAAIQSGMDRNYQPMEKLFAELIGRSLAA